MLVVTGYRRVRSSEPQCLLDEMKNFTSHSNFYRSLEELEALSEMFINPAYCKDHPAPSYECVWKPTLRSRFNAWRLKRWLKKHG